MAAKKKATYKKFVSPLGVARYPKISYPDTKGQYADGRYKTDVVFDDVGLAAIKKMLTEFAAETIPHVKNPKLPIKTGKDDVTYVSFKGGWNAEKDEARKPFVGDAKRNPIPEGVTIGAGSKIKVAATMANYENGPNKGITIYLDGVQVLELVEGGGDVAGRFADEDGFVAEETTSDSNPGDEFESADALKL
jgi:hypothetical protein